ncbi:jg27793 [Pararge aegeria aegeria]|uniref:Jg27793 protein n=1 Tax=Pararge aegeria aegeria TaxID=348720 RepID=A0A8S4S1R6_9NEOP|nr:jg27793 [Pararge aegeria aegeria]
MEYRYGGFRRRTRFIDIVQRIAKLCRNGQIALRTDGRWDSMVVKVRSRIGKRSVPRGGQTTSSESQGAAGKKLLEHPIKDEDIEATTR